MKWTSLVLVTVCMHGCKGGEESAKGDAGLVANPEARVERSEVTLSTGVQVDTYGTREGLDALSANPTPDEFCETFALSITATTTAAGDVEAYAAAGSQRLLESTSEPSLIQGLGGYLAPLFPASEVQTERTFGGVESIPVAVYPVGLAPSVDTERRLPQAVAIHHRSTKAPMAVFGYGEGLDELTFPRTWTSVGPNHSKSASDIWVRFMDGQEQLDVCPGASAALQATVNLPVVANLATCGPLVSWVTPRANPSVGLANGAGCPENGQGFAVTITPVSRNEWGDMSCPASAEAEFPHACFRAEGS